MAENRNEHGREQNEIGENQNVCEGLGVHYCVWVQVFPSVSDCVCIVGLFSSLCICDGGVESEVCVDLYKEICIALF